MTENTEKKRSDLCLKSESAWIITSQHRQCNKDESDAAGLFQNQDVQNLK